MSNVPRTPEHPLARYRVLLVAAGVVATAAALWFAIDVWRPLPGRTFVMAAGAPGEAHEGFAAQYQRIIARDHVALQLRPSAGAAENLALLRDRGSGVSAAFVVAGAVPPDANDELVSLGTVFYEPLWLFRRCDRPLNSVADFKGLRLSIGPPGSAGHGIALELLRLNGIARSDLELLELAPAEAASRLKSGALDAAFLTAAWESPVLRRLLLADGVRLMSFPRADAYVALYPFLTRLELPMGVADLAANRPPENVTLVAAKAELAVRRDLHPALQSLLINAATEVHGRPGIFQAARQFPVPESIDLPISETARQYYLNGPSFLKRHLPFWFGVMIERVLLVLAPLLGILYPLWSGLPRLYRWQINHRIYRLYGELKLIERELHDAPPGTRRDELLQRLAQLDERTFRVHLPNAYAPMGYALKMHIRNLRAAYGPAEAGDGGHAAANQR